MNLKQADLDNARAFADECPPGTTPYEAYLAGKTDERQRAADVASWYEPHRTRGGYADGLIEGNPMKDIAEEILRGPE